MAAGTREFTSPEAAAASPLAQAIFDTGEVSNVMFGRDFVSVTAAPAVSWTDLKPVVVSILLDHFVRSEEHTSELQSLMRISYAVFCLKKKKKKRQTNNKTQRSQVHTIMTH